MSHRAMDPEDYFEQLEQSRDERWLDRMDRRYGRVEDHRKKETDEQH